MHAFTIAMRPLLFWIMLDCWTSTAVLSSIDFAKQPATKYAYSNRSSSFQCVCSGCAGNFWKINSINANYPINKDKGVTSTGAVVNSDGFNEYTLSVPGIPFFNNSNITCIIYKGFNVKISNIAKLYIQGYASAVTNISVIQLNSTSLQLQFQPSYALDDTVSVDYYIIEVTGVGNYYMSILNSSSTVVTVLMTDPCTCYIISVTPHNDVGLGEKIIETDVIVFQEPTTVDEVSFEKKFKQNFVLFNVDTSCLGSIPQLMDVSITCLSTNSSCTSTHISSCLLNILSAVDGDCSIDIRNSSLSNIMEVEMNLTEHLSQGYHYMITVTLRTTSSPVVPSMMSTINLSTFDTVEASITSFSETSVCIKCSLRADSTMTGCLAIFEDHEDKVIKYAIKGVPDEIIVYDCFDDLQDGMYKVSVTDMTFYDSHHEHIAFVLSNNLTIKNEHAVTSSLRTSLAVNGMESIHLMMSSSMYQSSTSDEEIISIAVTPDVTTTTVNESKDSNTSLILTVVLLSVMGSFVILVLLIVTFVCYCKKMQSRKGGQSNDEFDVAEVAMKTCVAYETCSINPAYATINQRREKVSRVSLN